MEKNFYLSDERNEVEKIIRNVKRESGMDTLPETLTALSRISFNLFAEHVKEKSELLHPLSLDMKSVFLIAYAVSVSISSEVCSKTYLSQFIRIGGTLPEIEDAISVARFISGNRAFISSSEILKKLSESGFQK